MKPHCVSLGCSLEKTIGLAGAKYGHRRGWEWDAGKEEMANDSTAARRTVCLTREVASMLKWKKSQSPKKKEKRKKKNSSN